MAILGKEGTVDVIIAKIAIMRAFDLTQAEIATRLDCADKSVFNWLKEHKDMIDRIAVFVRGFSDLQRVEVEKLVKDDYVKKHEDLLGEVYAIRQKLMRSSDPTIATANINRIEDRVLGRPKNTTRHEGDVTHNVKLMPGPMPAIEKGNERRAQKRLNETVKMPVTATVAHDDGDHTEPAD